MPSECWNHNIHYHRVILNAIPPGCRRALDVGCGEGTLTRELRQLIPEVVGVDSDHASIAAAQAHPEAGDVQYVEGDALAYAARADVIRSHHRRRVAAPHARRARLGPPQESPATGRCAGRPSGTGSLIADDWPLDLAAIVPNPGGDSAAHYWQHPSPVVWPPPENYASMRRITARVLPGARFQRRLYWRYTIIWAKS